MKKRTSLLLVGATGFVGSSLLAGLAGDYRVHAVCGNSPPTGPADRWSRWDGAPSALRELVLASSPEIVVNASAASSVVGCARDSAGAARLNTHAPRLLAEACAATGARLLHLSTDQVFDGRSGHYVECDEPRPISVYGSTKLAGEVAVLSSRHRALVVRLNLVCGPSCGPRPSGDDRLLAAAREGRPLPLFTDEYRSPIHVEDVVHALRELIELDVPGLLHLGGPERLSRHDLGTRLLRAHGLAHVARAASLASYDGPPRAPDTSFDSSRALGLLDRPPRAISDWP